MKSMRKFFIDPIAMGFVIVGVILMALALHFQINPACAGAIQGAIKDYPICLAVLEVLTIPAIFMGVILGSPMVIGRTLSSYLFNSGLIYAFIYISQILIYFLAVKIISLGVYLIRKIWENQP
jgi:hypothetical protein